MEYQLDQINIYPIGNIEANYEESIQSPVGNKSTTVIFMVHYKVFILYQLLYVK